MAWNCLLEENFAGFQAVAHDASVLRLAFAQDDPALMTRALQYLTAAGIELPAAATVLQWELSFNAKFFLCKRQLHYPDYNEIWTYLLSTLYSWDLLTEYSLAVLETPIPLTEATLMALVRSHDKLKHYEVIWSKIPDRSAVQGNVNCLKALCESVYTSDVKKNVRIGFAVVLPEFTEATFAFFCQHEELITKFQEYLPRLKLEYLNYLTLGAAARFHLPLEAIFVPAEPLLPVYSDLEIHGSTRLVIYQGQAAAKIKLNQDPTAKGRWGYTIQGLDAYDHQVAAHLGYPVRPFGRGKRVCSYELISDLLVHQDYRIVYRFQNENTSEEQKLAVAFLKGSHKMEDLTVENVPILVRYEYVF